MKLKYFAFCSVIYSKAIEISVIMRYALTALKTENINILYTKQANNSNKNNGNNNNNTGKTKHPHNSYNNINKYETKTMAQMLGRVNRTRVLSVFNIRQEILL